jgi:uncharacterized LabA/DUF88 family protein
MDDAAVFIDGFNLYHGICEAGLKPWLWVDLGKLARVLVPSSLNVCEVNYYTAHSKQEGSRERQGAFLEANRELNPTGLNIVTGFMQQADCCTCRKCSITFRRWQEKRTDVNMAVDIVKGAMEPKPRFQVAMLVTGDADQAAAVEVARQCGLRVLIRFPPNRHSTELETAAGGNQNAYLMTQKQLEKAQMPDTVHRLGGKNTILRPGQWGER